ncbi:MAG: EAL domain-containing protein, partial [Comamonadaceae bacterium]
MVRGGPKVDLASRQVRHVEALLRWTHPEWGPVPPDEFIPLAERSGFVH